MRKDCAEIEVEKMIKKAEHLEWGRRLSMARNKT